MSLGIESNVRSYCRKIPAVFTRGRNAELWDESGRRHIDLLAACGALNYGHNHPHIKRALLDYVDHDGVGTAMDLNTTAKRRFLDTLRHVILDPRGLDYKVQFTGPTGTNAVEAALKLARKLTGRRTVVAFSNGFHGMTLGALAATGNAMARQAAGVPLEHITRLPYDGFAGASLTDLEGYARLVENSSGGLEPPAAFLVETVQGEGGLNVASAEWLLGLSRLAERLGALLIVDDVQAGCGRTGTFFSFERTGIVPDMVCLAKSIGGYGLPLAVVLLKPALDVWQPAEHNGTFRAQTLSLVTGAAALELWQDGTLERSVQDKAALIRHWIEEVCASYPGQMSAKGIGLMQGVVFRSSSQAASVANVAISRNLLIECCGPDDEVVKLLPPLTIEIAVLDEALDRLRGAIDQVLSAASRVRLAAE
jgi:diaminobutyrate-2-oxoglutarate transaminase